MTINQLRAFLCVCRYLNYTVAADKLYMTRQALRQNISSLERELNTPLFVNTANRIGLTAVGRSLRDEAAPVVESFDAMESRIFSAVKSDRRLKICVSSAVVPDFLPNLKHALESFAEKEHLCFDYAIVLNEKVSGSVLSGEADCGIVMDMRSAKPELHRTELSAHPCSIMVSCGHRFWSRDSVSVAELGGERICLPGNSIEFSPFFNEFDRCGLSADFKYYDSFYQVYYNVRENGHISINRYSPIENASPDYTNDIILEGMPPLCSSFITKESCSKEIRAIGEHLKEHYAKIFA